MGPSDRVLAQRKQRAPSQARARQFVTRFPWSEQSGHPRPRVPWTWPNEAWLGRIHGPEVV